MKRQLVMRPRAELDLLEHCAYLSECEPRSATRLTQATRMAIAGIKSSPHSGSMLNLASFADVELRFRKPRGFKNYLVIYQVADDCVFILRILHGSQDIESALRQ